MVKKCYGQRLWGTSGHGDYVYIAYVKENDTVFVWLKSTHNRSLPYQSCYTYSCLRTKEIMVYKWSLNTTLPNMLYKLWMINNMLSVLYKFASSYNRKNGWHMFTDSPLNLNTTVHWQYVLKQTYFSRDDWFIICNDWIPLINNDWI